MTKKYLVKIEDGPTTKWLLGNDELAESIKRTVYFKVMEHTGGAVPSVTVIQQECPPPCGCGGYCPACAVK